MNDIEQGNVVIAKFLGWTPKERFHYLRNKTVIEWENCPYEYIEVGTEQFHTSWDWLMPVVEKIETISTDEIKSISFSLDSRGWSAWIKNRSGDQNMPQWYCDNDTIPKLESIWQACINFINWYELQTH